MIHVYRYDLGLSFADTLIREDEKIESFLYFSIYDPIPADSELIGRFAKIEDLYSILQNDIENNPRSKANFSKFCERHL